MAITLNIPLEELNKVKQGMPFYIIKPIIKGKWDKSKIKDKIIKQRSSTTQFKVLQYSVFEDLNTLFDFYNYSLFRVGKSKKDVISYYSKIYGRTILKENFVLVVFKLRNL